MAIVKREITTCSLGKPVKANLEDIPPVLKQTYGGRLGVYPYTLNSDTLAFFPSPLVRDETVGYDWHVSHPINKSAIKLSSGNFIEAYHSLHVSVQHKNLKTFYEVMYEAMKSKGFYMLYQQVLYRLGGLCQDGTEILLLPIGQKY